MFVRSFVGRLFRCFCFFFFVECNIWIIDGNVHCLFIEARKPHTQSLLCQPQSKRHKKTIAVLEGDKEEKKTEKRINKKRRYPITVKHLYIFLSSNRSNPVRSSVRFVLTLSIPLSLSLPLSCLIIITQFQFSMHCNVSAIRIWMRLCLNKFFFQEKNQKKKSKKKKKIKSFQSFSLAFSLTTSPLTVETILLLSTRY